MADIRGSQLAGVTGRAVDRGSSPTLFAHDLPLEEAAELGILGFLLAAALYLTTADAIRRARGSPALWLLAPGLAAFLIANLLDWPWHLAGLGAIWALAAGGLVAAGASTSAGPGGQTLGLRRRAHDRFRTSEQVAGTQRRVDLPLTPEPA